MKCTVKLRVRDGYAESATHSEIVEQLEAIVFESLKNNIHSNEIEESEELDCMVFTMTVYHHVNQIVQTLAPMSGPGSFYYIMSINTEED